MSSRILIVDDEVRFRELYAQTLEDSGFTAQTAASAEEALSVIQDSAPALVVSDVRMPGADGIELLRKTRQTRPELPFLLVTAYADVRGAVTALRLGAVDYLAKPVDLDELVAAVRDALGVKAGEPGFEVPSEALSGIIAESPAMRAVLRDAYRVARSEATVLLTGESGTGKEVVARFIHDNSPRGRKPFVPVNCAAIPATLLGSELFGHEKGAFTGATAQRGGRFREAEGGTLFLDEIGDMALDLQPALLRAIETRRILPVGSDAEVAVDFRLIASTNRDLQQHVEQRRFREDLYYRLNVIALELPPLREREEDILPLAAYFLRQGEGENKRLSRAVRKALTVHTWPGNVRELANALEHARLLSPTDVVLPEQLPPAVRQSAGKAAAEGPEVTEPGRPAVKTLEESEIDAIRRALEQTDGNRTRAAGLLGITRRGLIYKLKRLGI